MHTLVASVFTGKWRSFKIFKRSGDIRLHTDKHFEEFDFNDNKELVIKTYDGNHIKKVVETDQWAIVFNNKRHYLNIIAPKLLYEVITINHTVMVLSHIASGEKTFFAKNNDWKERLETNHMVLL